MNFSSLSAEELTRICAEGGAREAWEEFVQRFNPVIAGVVVRTARRWVQPSRQLLDDLVQDTYLKLCADNCRLLRTFEARQPDAIYGYLKTVAANVVHDHFKAAHAVKRGSGNAVLQDGPEENVMEQIPDQKEPASVGMDREVLIQQIDQHLGHIVEAEELTRSRLIFWLYYRSGLTASAIARVPGVSLSTKGVESALLRMTRSLRTALAAPSNSPGVKNRDPDRGQKGSAPQKSF
jgi:RNA polymerase sigma-70 factor (ECF subfamily)